MSSQLKQFLDTLGPQWGEGLLADKTYAGFTAAQTAHGGHESTLLALYNTLHHFGGILVSPGYTDPVKFADGNPYGVSHATGADNDEPARPGGARRAAAPRRAGRLGDRRPAAGPRRGLSGGHATAPERVRRRAMTDRTARVDTVVLDIDGTLVDSNFHHVVAWSRAFRSVGHEVPGWRIHRALGMGGDRLVSHVAGAGVEEASGDAVRAAWEKEYDAMLERARRLRRGARAAGRAAAARPPGRPGELGDPAPRVRSHGAPRGGAGAGATPPTTSEDAEDTKPDPELLEVAVERVDGSSSIVVGDAVWDVEAAQRLGVPAVALLSGGVGEAELRSAGAAWVFRDVAELRERLDTVLMPVA